MFQLHPQLAKDTPPLGKFKLCRLLLINDGNYSWFILLPERRIICEAIRSAGESALIFTIRPKKVL